MPLSRKDRKTRRRRAASRKDRKSRRRAAASRKDRKSRRRAASRRAASRRTAQRGGVMEYDHATSGEQLLNSSMAAAARVAPLDAAFAEIRALDAPVAGPMQGGRRRRGASRKSRKSRKGRKQRGGQYGGQQDISAPSMLLDSRMYKDAGLNPEWKQYQ